VKKLIIRHLSGHRANQIDQFPAIASEIVFGREPGVNVQYDADHEDLVSRRHMKLTVDQSGNCQITDLESRNGVFLNQRRLSGSTRIAHNDVVQLGIGGPEFRFETDPAPGVEKPTRVIDTVEAAAFKPRETRISTALPAAPRPIGRATVERMLDANFNQVRKQSNKLLWSALTAAVLCFAIGLVFYLRLNKSAEQNQQLVAQQQQLLQQMNQQIKLQPQQTAAMREQMAQLSDEIKKSEQRNERTMQAVSKAINGGEQKTDSAKPAAAPTQGNAFEQQVKSVLAEAQNNPAQAAKEATALIAQYPRKWESYGAAGYVLRSQNRLPQAKIAYQRALDLAPDDVKPQIAAVIHQIDTTSSGAVSQ